MKLGSLLPVTWKAISHHGIFGIAFHPEVKEKLVPVQGGCEDNGQAPSGPKPPNPQRTLDTGKTAPLSFDPHSETPKG